MGGPTPVSSIIHSATMVAAGVYLLARFFPTVEAAPGEVHTLIAYVGGFTAIFAATMGIVATDIKRVLAYSTISQLGRSEEHTSELQSLMRRSYAVFCLKKTNKTIPNHLY